MMTSRAKKTAATRKSTENPVKVRSFIICEYQDRLENLLSQALSDGWELMAQPVFVRKGEPSGSNGYVVGFDWPHFLILLKKDNRAPVVG